MINFQLCKLQNIYLLPFLFFLLISVNTSYSQNLKEIWTDIPESSVSQKGDRLIIPAKYRTTSLNLNLFKEMVSSAPGENEVLIEDARPITVEFPSPDGDMQRFFIMEAPIMEEALSAKYPEIKTYRGQGIDDKTASIRFDLTPQGFHSMVISASGNWFIDPYDNKTDKTYISYWKRDLPYDESKFFLEEGPLDTDSEIAQEIAQLVANGIDKSSGDQLRTYRLAVATTGEYTAFHGGTVPLGLAAVVTAMNRVDLVYETEVSVRMVLVANNDLIIYTNSSTDPYTNSSGSTMLSQNQSNLDAVIGSANYDVGHVFSTGGGGIASLGVPCRTGFKARGVTGLPSPIGDPFYIDYVAHEMGHQFGANHTFNGSAGSCSGGNRNASTAYEPGSGSTIMAYAGICSPQDLQNFSDAYFHGISIDEIVAYTTLSSGNTCPVITSTGNTAPVVNSLTGGFTIPINTPFTITGSATDVNGDAITYNWEEFDLGPAGAPTSPTLNAPIFRSFFATTSPSRTFPKLTNILNNTSTIGEILPSYTRTLTFRLTARDNRSGGGGVGKNSFTFNVSSTAGPFLVTSPNTNVSWNGNSIQTITWSVANTNIAPVSVTEVNILLSTDGGNTFNTSIAVSTPNDGSEDIFLPNTPTTSARIKIEAVGNIFFDISNANFTIVDNPIPVELTSFKAFADNQNVELQWETASEINNKGFEIYRKSELANLNLIGFINGKGTTTEKQYYRFTDNNLSAGVYHYQLKQIDFDGKSTLSEFVEAEITSPKYYSLEQNHPNPFNPSTKISWQSPVNSWQTLKVYDVLGNEIAMLVDDFKPAGLYEIEFPSDNVSLASGLYYYQLSVRGVDGSNFLSTKKMMLIK
jgi:hypothetical protein